MGAARLGHLFTVPCAFSANRFYVKQILFCRKRNLSGDPQSLLQQISLFSMGIEKKCSCAAFSLHCQSAIETSSQPIGRGHLVLSSSLTLCGHACEVQLAPCAYNLTYNDEEFIYAIVRQRPTQEPHQRSGTWLKAEISRGQPCIVQVKL